MKSFLRPLLAGGFSAATALVLSTGCVEERASIYIDGVLKPQEPECNVENDPTAAQWPRGALDIAITGAYDASLLVGNQLTPRGDKVQAKAETMRVALTAAEVTLLNAVGEQLTCPEDEECARFSIYGSGAITVTKSEDPAWGTFAARLIPPVVVQAIAPDVLASGAVTVVASVKVRGTTLGGKEVESGEFIFPIDVCYGCLLRYNSIVPGCCNRAQGEGEDEVCRPGQDEQTSCTQCGGDICDKADPSIDCTATPTP